MTEQLKPAIKFFIDIVCALFALSLAYSFLYNFDFVYKNFTDIFFEFILFSGAYFLSSLLTKHYASVWAYASLSEVLRLATNVSLSFLILFILALLFSFDLNYKALVLFYLLFSFFAANMRLLRRFLKEREKILQGSKRTIIVGANSKTNNFLKNPVNRNLYDIIGILTDKYDTGKTVFAYKVIGNTSQLRSIVKEMDIEIVIYTGIFDNDLFVKKNFLREIVNLSVTLLTLEESLKKDIPLTLSSMDQVREIEQTLLKNVEQDKSKNVLVTGGAGYIGVHLLKLLLDDGYNVTLLDNFTFGEEPVAHLKDHKNLKIINGDISNIKDLVKSVKNNRFVIALAAIVGDPASSIDAEETLNLNYESTKSLTEICNFYEVEKLIFASSCSVYGSNDSDILNEESYLNPVSLYARTRIYSENYLLDNCKSTSPTIMRLSTVFGFSTRMRYDLVVNTLLVRALRDKKYNVFGGDQWRPFVHCYDVARAFKIAMESDKSITHNQIFNVGSNDMNFTINDIGQKVHDKIPESSFNTIEEEFDKRNYRVSFNKISNVLGFKKTFDIEMGIDEMIKNIGNDSNLLNYENKIYSNVNYLKDRFKVE